MTLTLWQTRKGMKDRGRNERERAGSALIAPGPHCEWAVHPERDGGKEDKKREKEREFPYPPVFDACGAPL